MAWRLPEGEVPYWRGRVTRFAFDTGGEEGAVHASGLETH